MSRRPFDPSEIDQPSTDADLAASELERYVAASAADAPRGLDERIMAAVDREPAPRRGLGAWLFAPLASDGGVRRAARATALAATLVLAVAGALFAGQLADLVRHVGGASPTPTESISPTPTISPTPSVTTSPASSESGSPGESAAESSGAGASGQPGGNPGTSPGQTAEPPAESQAEDSKTPTASPTPSPTQTP